MIFLRLTVTSEDSTFTFRKIISSKTETMLTLRFCLTIIIADGERPQLKNIADMLFNINKLPENHLAKPNYHKELALAPTPLNIDVTH